MERRANSKLIIALALFAGTAFLARPGETQDSDPVPYGLPFVEGIKPETVCGPGNDLQDVELYDGSLGVTLDYVAANQGSTVQFQWKPERAIRRDQMGRPNLILRRTKNAWEHRCSNRVITTGSPVAWQACYKCLHATSPANSMQFGGKSANNR